MSHGIIKKTRVIAIAIALTFAINFAMSQVIESGGVELPKPPRPSPTALDSGGVELPKPPRP
jgi:hypothetical protein